MLRDLTAWWTRITLFSGGNCCIEKTTSLTYLYYSTGSDFEKLIDITSYPDLFTAPEKIDISTLSSNQRQYAPGMVDLPDYSFGFVWDKENYEKIKALEGKETEFQLRFGENGEYGAWQWTGDIFARPLGGSVGSARTGEIICYPSTDVVPTTVS